MPENNDPKAGAEMPAGNPGSGMSGSNEPDLDPIFVSFIYDFAETEPQTGLGGSGLGKPGTIGAPINQHPPRFRVFTYPFIPFRGGNIGNT